ncbi:hypothetical protein [Actinophytocola sp.]|uniref:hypothetical protein n=1 Tax=Actinophytocola sp. TaxID=1872138 RepID=UPI002ED4CE1D
MMILPVITVVAGIVLTSWFSLRKLATREKFRTCRFAEALKGTNPWERPEIIRALSCLEEGGDNETASVTTPSSSDPTAAENRVIFDELRRIGGHATTTESH